MKVSGRESVLLLATIAALLFGVTVMKARDRIEVWKGLRVQQADLRDSIARDLELAGERQRWEDEFSELREMLPQFPADKDMDVHWLTVMENAASKHGIKILQRQARKEIRNGDIYEMPIECKDWQGTLDQLVNFLYELQSEGAMLDVRQLLVKPKGKGILRGRFTLYCAYTRG